MSMAEQLVAPVNVSVRGPRIALTCGDGEDGLRGGGGPEQHEQHDEEDQDGEDDEYWEEAPGARGGAPEKERGGHLIPLLFEGYEAQPARPSAPPGRPLKD